MSDLPQDFETPDELLAHLWDGLHAGVADRSAANHLATLSSIALDGAPAARSVILRAVSIADRTLSFHTDRRSTKIAEIECDPRVALHFWNPASRTQLRITGTARVLVDDDARPMIESAHPGSLAVYRSVEAPSAPVDSPREVRLADAPLLENVAVVSVKVNQVDWLWLDEKMHLRCRFVYEGGRVSHQWLVP